MALIVTRKAREEIVIKIGDTEVTVFVKEIKPFTVDIGVDAPNHVAVNRREIHDAKVRDGVL